RCRSEEEGARSKGSRQATEIGRIEPSGATTERVPSKRVTDRARRPGRERGGASSAGRDVGRRRRDQGVGGDDRRARQRLIGGRGAIGGASPSNPRRGA